MNNVITSTGYKLPQSVVSNGLVTGNEWSTPQNIFLSDDLFAVADTAEGSASDFIIGNYAFGIPTDAIITGFVIKILGEKGAQTVPPLTLTLSAVKDGDGSNAYFPFTAPFTGLTPTNEEHILGTQNYLFDTTWTAVEANNFKLLLQANGNISLDTVAVDVFYYVPIAPEPPEPVDPGCIDCNSPIQVQAMSLALDFLIGDTKFYLKKGSFSYSDGTPVQPGDVGSCGGEVTFTFDKNLRRIGNGNFAETAVVDVGNGGTWTVLESGIIEVDIDVVTNRGLKSYTPWDHDANLMSNHQANSEVVISNSGRFYKRFVRECQKDIVFSVPITIQDEGVDVVTAVHDIDFVGDNVQAEQYPGDANKAIVTILTNPTNNEPTVEDTSSDTTGSGTAGDLTFSHTIVDANYLRVWISTDDETISSVTFDGVAMTLVGSETNVAGDLKVALYGLVAPNPGTHSIVVTMAAPSHITAGGVSFLNVDTTNPTDTVSSGNNGNGTAPTDSITTTSQNSIVQDVVGAVNNATTFAQVSPWVIVDHVDAAARPGASSTRRVLVPASVTDTYEIDPTGQWAIILAGVRGSTVASTTDEKVKVDSSDTTPGFLDPKIEVIAGNGSVTVTKTILNPGANEKIRYSIVVPNAAVLNNPTASTNPTVNDDSGDGYSIGSYWFNAVSQTLYIAQSVGVGAANWVAVGSGGGGSLEVEINGVSLETGVTKINFTGNVSGLNPVSGEVDIDIQGGGGSGGTKLDIQTSGVALNGSTTETTLYTVGVPGGTLGANNALRVYMPISSYGNGGNKTVRVKYGGSTVVTLSGSDPTGSITNAFVRGMIIADGATNAQKFQFELIVNGELVDVEYGTAAIDSTTAQNLVLTGQLSSVGGVFTTSAIVVEVITASGSGSVTQVTDLEDFIAFKIIAAGGTSTDRYFSWGQWFGDETSFPSQELNETNHPGIVKLGGTADTLRGFIGQESSGPSVPGGGLCLTNDLEMEFLTRIIYSGSITSQNEWGIDGDDQIKAVVTHSAGVETVGYIINGSVIPTAAVCPASNTWFKVNISYISGILTIVLDGQTLYTGAQSFSASSTNYGYVLNSQNSTDVDIDYIQTKYTVVR